VIDVAEFETRARAWVRENLMPANPPESRSVEYYTPDIVAQNRALQLRIYEAGYAGIAIPQEYGGQGLTPQHDAAFRAATIGYQLPDIGTSTITTWRVCVPILLAYGQSDLLNKIIRQALRGEALICQFFSEPSSGSDLAGARTQAIADGDGWIVRGQKTWSTFAQLADFGLCLARTNWDVPKHRGLTWFLIPCHDERVTIRPIRQITGGSSFCDSFFDDVRIPDTYRIGEVDDGWHVAQRMLVMERGSSQVAVRSSRPEPGALAPDAVAAARDAGRTDDPLARQRVARMHSIDYVFQALHWRLQELARLDRMTPGLAAYGKLFRGTHRPVRARLGVEIGGAAGLTWDSAGSDIGSELVFSYLDGRHSSIAGGTNEMQRNAISEQALGMPRERSVDTGRPYRDVLAELRDKK
jgi:alkylation response protein AidB-like acyl-CoA dehydrogenase